MITIERKKGEKINRALLQEMKHRKAILGNRWNRVARRIRHEEAKCT